MNATRNISNSFEEIFYVGNYFVVPITKEEYKTLQTIKQECCLEKDRRWIVYMNDFPVEVKAEYAKKILAFHKDSYNTSIEELEKKVADLEEELHRKTMDLKHLKELQDLVNWEEMEY